MRHVRLTLVLLLAAALLAGGAVLALAGGSRPGPRAATSGAFAREVAYLASAQNADGGFGGARGQSSSELFSAWAAIGLAAAGRDPLTLRREGHTVLDALRGEAATLHGAGDLERTILALRACGVSTHSLGAGGDPVVRLLALGARDGSFGEQANLTAFAVLALKAAGYGANTPRLRAAARWLVRQQNTDGGFGFATRGGPSDVDDTAAAVQALVTARIQGGATARARRYLLRAQNLDGGFPQQPGDDSNAQSTAWAIQGLTAAGADVRNFSRQGSRSPGAYLDSLVAADGSVRYSRTGAQTPVWVTAQALTGLAARPLPIAPPRPPPRP
jgi:prenyltransferase beta subunit